MVLVFINKDALNSLYRKIFFMVRIDRKSTIFEAYSSSHFIETETQFLWEIRYIILLKSVSAMQLDVWT